MVNSRDIGLLRPDVQANCRIWMDMCKAAGLNVLVVSTVRDEEYQRYCVAQGYAPKTATVPTFHSVRAGLAFDFCKNVKGQEYSDLGFFSKCAEIAKKMGFVWGGDWKNPDRPHIQWGGPNKSWTSAQILRGELPPQMPLYKKEDEYMREQININVIGKKINIEGIWDKGNAFYGAQGLAAILTPLGFKLTWDNANKIHVIEKQ